MEKGSDTHAFMDMILTWTNTAMEKGSGTYVFMDMVLTWIS